MMPRNYDFVGLTVEYAAFNETHHYDDPVFLALPSGQIIVQYEDTYSPFGSGINPTEIRGFVRPDYDPENYGGLGQFELEPSLALLTSGNILVTWEYAQHADIAPISEYDIAFAIVDTQGNYVVNPQLGNLTTDGAQRDAINRPLENGGFVLAWNSEGQDGSGSGVYARIFDDNGLTVAAEFSVNETTAGNQRLSDIVVGADGNILIVWTSDSGPHVRLFSNLGEPLGGEVQLAPNADSDVSIIALSGGGFVATWNSEEHSGSSSGVFYQILSATGVPIGQPRAVNTTTAEDQNAQEVIQLANGNFAIVWQSEGQDGSGAGIFARFFASDGTALTGELQINQTSAGDQHNFDLAALPDGDLIVSWTSGGYESQIMVRSLSQDGEFLGGEVAIAPSGQWSDSITNDDSQIVVRPDGTFHIGWSAYTSGYTAVFGQDFVSNQIGTGVPVIQGVPRLGQTLTVDLSGIDDADGFDPDAITYRWLRDGMEISTEPTYTLGRLDVGASLSVEIVITDDLGVRQTYVGAPTTAVGMVGETTSGDDDFTGTSGSDFIDGGTGNDIIRGGDGDDTILGGAGNDALGGGDGLDFISGDQGNDVVRGGIREDTLIGGAGDDRLFGEAGFDLLVGGVGNDLLNGGAQADNLLGGDGDDTLQGEDGVDKLFGNEGNDSLTGGTLNDLLDGGEGDDTLEGGEDDDVLLGDAGHDQLYGNSGLDLIFGGSGNDMLDGGMGEDTLRGGEGFDLLSGGDGNDVMDGGDQADNLLGGNGNDLLIGGDGFDRLFGGNDDDRLLGGRETDALFGQNGHDVIYGQWGEDRLFGGAGNDTLDGGANDDTMSGGAGFDTLIGSLGNDILTGNFNADVFVFADNHGFDTITDFDAANDFERIDLRGVSEVTSFLDLIRNHVTQVGSDIEIDTGDGLITLVDVAFSALDQNDFII